MKMSNLSISAGQQVHAEKYQLSENCETCTRLTTNQGESYITETIDTRGEAHNTEYLWE